MDRLKRLAAPLRNTKRLHVHGPAYEEDSGILLWFESETVMLRTVYLLWKSMVAEASCRLDKWFMKTQKKKSSRFHRPDWCVDGSRDEISEMASDFEIGYGDWKQYIRDRKILKHIIEDGKTLGNERLNESNEQYRWNPNLMESMSEYVIIKYNSRSLPHICTVILLPLFILTLFLPFLSHSSFCIIITPLAH